MRFSYGYPPETKEGLIAPSRIRVDYSKLHVADVGFALIVIFPLIALPFVAHFGFGTLGIL